MVEEFGMSEKIGPVALARPRVFLGPTELRSEALSPGVANDVDAEVRRLVEEAESRASALLSGRRVLLDELAGQLLEREELEGDELRAAVAERGVAAHA